MEPACSGSGRTGGITLSCIITARGRAVSNALRTAKRLQKRKRLLPVKLVEDRAEMIEHIAWQQRLFAFAFFENRNLG